MMTAGTASRPDWFDRQLTSAARGLYRVFCLCRLLIGRQLGAGSGIGLGVVEDVSGAEGPVMGRVSSQSASQSTDAARMASAKSRAISGTRLRMGERTEGYESGTLAGIDEEDCSRKYAGDCCKPERQGGGTGFKRSQG
jgi:hypothetical protein